MSTENKISHRDALIRLWKHEETEDYGRFHERKWQETGFLASLGSVWR